MKKLILSLALVGLVSGVSLVKANTVVATKNEYEKTEKASGVESEEEETDENDDDSNDDAE